jgi:predicted phage terminase large subunit-like protein
MDLWSQWEGLLHDFELSDEEREARARAFYEARQEEMSRGTEGKILWPAREPLYELMKLRAVIGPAAFASEKQGDPINPESCEWPSDYFDGPGFWFHDWPDRPLARSLALDPSKGTDSKVGDYSAFVKLAVYDNPLRLYVEADIKRRDTAQIVADGVEHVHLWQPDWFGLETNSFQELFAPDFRRAAQEEKVFLPLFGIPNTVNKEVRIRRLTPYLSQRQLRFKARSPGTLLLVQQLKDFPQGDHDDGPDALEMAIRLGVEQIRKKLR